MIKKIKSKEGLILPLAILLMLMAAGIIWNMGNLLIDKMAINNNDNLVSMAQREAENALVYGVWGSNTAQANGGHKKICGGSGWDYTTTKTEITNEDKGQTSTIEGYKIKRYINYQESGYLSVSDTKATLVGIAEIYDTTGLIKLAEKAVAMDVNLGYNGGTGTSACNSSVVQMYKETWRTVK